MLLTDVLAFCLNIIHLTPLVPNRLCLSRFPRSALALAASPGLPWHSRIFQVRLTFILLCLKPGFELLKCPRFEVRKQTTSTRVFETSRFKDPLVSDPPSISLGFEEVSKLRWARVGGRTSTRRVKYELRGLPFMLPIMAPVGVEAASHVFAALAIGAAPPVTGKRQRCM